MSAGDVWQCILLNNQLPRYEEVATKCQRYRILWTVSNE